MTGNIVRICATQEKSLVEVHRRNIKMLGFQRIACFEAFPKGFWTVLMARSVDIEIPIWYY
jgi:hypothetical protein